MPRRHDILDRIRQLVALPSVSSTLPELDQSNLPVIELLAEWLTDADFQTEILPVNHQKYNLIATKGSGAGGLVLSGHTDTVPAEEKNWSYNPFQLTEDQGRLYGLGASDMKSFLALAVEAARDVPADRLEQPLIILATADEESTMSGAQAILDNGKLKARYALIGEPTGNRPIRMHKGVMLERILVTGQAGHSSNPATGKNAVEGMHTVISELLALRQEMQSRYQNPLFEVPVPTLNLGRIKGGDTANRICETCTLDIDLRPLPGMELSELRHLLQRRLSACLLDTGFKLKMSPLFQGTPALETPAESRLVKMLESLTGQSAGSVAFATEGPYLQRLGMEVVIMGPGQIAQAHQPDEYIELSYLESTLRLLQKIIEQCCVMGY